jgi:hypothetical protein
MKAPCDKLDYIWRIGHLKGIMGKEDKRTPELRLIRGSLSSKMSIGNLQVVASPKDAPPFRVDAFVFEEDTFLVMSADTTVRDAKESMVRIMARLMETRPVAPGSVLVRGKDPLQFLAIVHDFNEDPSFKEEWLVSALEGIFKTSERVQLHSLALPLIGTHYGFVKTERFVDLLESAIKGATLQHLRRLWLMVPSGSAREMIQRLKDRFKREETVGQS